MSGWLLKLYRNEKGQGWLIGFTMVMASLLAGAAVFLLLKTNPLEAYQGFLEGAGLLRKDNYPGAKSMLTDFTSFLNALTPLIFSALAVSLGLRAGLFNIGVSGQMLFSGFLASVLIGYGQISSLPAKCLVILIGIVAGGCLGIFTGWLKVKFGVNEVVSTIMLNYIIRYVVGFFIQTYYINPVSRQSQPVSQASRLTLMNVQTGGLKIDLPLGMILALAAVFILQFMLKRTRRGFEIRASGAGSRAAAHAGMNPSGNMLYAMAISGALAGLAGVTFYLGCYGSIQPGVLPDMGFDGIAVALLGNNQPIGIFFASFFITIITKGSTYMSSMTGVEAEAAAIITGLVLLFCACRGYASGKLGRMLSRLKEKGDME